MKAHSNGFKQQIKLMGKEIDSIITIGNTVLGKNELNAVTPSFQGAILKSVMKQLDLDSNVDIPIGTILKYEFGLKVGDEYEYLNFGNYVVYSSEKQEDTGSYKITCFDKLLYSMVDYVNMNITYPITIRDYISKLCEHLGLNFANTNDNFANYDKEIPNELYLNSNNESMGFTFRDVLDQLAQVTASTICLNDNDEVEIKYINDTEDTINEEFLKDVNVNFGEKYGPVNSIVLSRAGGGDNIFLQDEESVATNGLHELKIENNEIMNFNNRSEYLPDILEKLNGLEFYVNDFTSTGVTYYDLCDRYSVKIGDNVYSCVMFNDEINVTQGLEEIIYTELPKETETDYKQASETDRLINQTYIIANQHTQEIEALTQKVIPVSNTISGIGEIQLENAYEGTLHKLSIKGNMSLLFPSNELNPSNDLYSKSSVLIIDETEYVLDFNFLNYLNNDVCDEFIYEDGKCHIIRRVGSDINGNLYPLEEETVEKKQDIVLNVKNNSIIKLKSFDNAILKAEYLLENEFTSNFVTEVDAVARLNLSPGNAKLQANKISLEGYTTINNGFSVDLDGNATMNNATMNGGKIKLNSSQGSPSAPVFTMKSNDGTDIVEFMPQWLILETDGKRIEITPQNNNVHGLIMSRNDLLSSNNPRFMFNEFLIKGIDAYKFNECSIFGIAGAESSDRYSSHLDVLDPQGITRIYGDRVESKAFNNTSLEEEKKNIVLFQNALKIIKDTDIYSFHWKTETNTDKKHFGMVIGNNYNTPEEFISKDQTGIDTYSTLSICLQAIKELNKKIEFLEQKVEELENGQR